MGRFHLKVISGVRARSDISPRRRDTWERMKEGLPEENGQDVDWVSRSNPEKVYALIESDSDKRGRWFICLEYAVRNGVVLPMTPAGSEPWYYIELFIDPKNETLFMS